VIHRFGAFELDLDRVELRRQGQPVPVEPQVFALIALLVEAAPRLVTREEIVARVWDGRIVSDAALSSRVKSARKALDDDGVAQKVIRPVHGQGFRFVAEKAAPVPAGQEADGGEALRREVLARPVLAVLPFALEDGSPEEAYFVDGLTEEVIGELASWRWFPVLSRASAFDPRHADLPAAARAGPWARATPSWGACAAGPPARASPWSCSTPRRPRSCGPGASTAPGRTCRASRRPSPRRCCAGSPPS